MIQLESPYYLRNRPEREKQGWLLDPLSDVLSLLKLRSYTVGGFDLGGKWSIQFRQHDGN